MHNNHRVSTEPDRLAYEAARNIIRLNRYRNQHQHLERMKDRLTQDLIQHYQNAPITCLAHGVKAGHAALHAGSDYEQALADAQSRIVVMP